MKYDRLSFACVSLISMSAALFVACEQADPVGVEGEPSEIAQKDQGAMRPPAGRPPVEPLPPGCSELKVPPPPPGYEKCPVEGAACANDGLPIRICDTGRGGAVFKCTEKGWALTARDGQIQCEAPAAPKPQPERPPAKPLPPGCSEVKVPPPPPGYEKCPVEGAACANDGPPIRICDTGRGGAVFKCTEKGWALTARDGQIQCEEPKPTPPPAEPAPAGCSVVKLPPPPPNTLKCPVEGASCTNDGPGLQLCDTGRGIALFKCSAKGWILEMRDGQIHCETPAPPAPVKCTTNELPPPPPAEVACPKPGDKCNVKARIPCAVDGRRALLRCDDAGKGPVWVIEQIACAK
jgi:hypothetical protein